MVSYFDDILGTSNQIIAHITQSQKSEITERKVSFENKTNKVGTHELLYAYGRCVLAKLHITTEF